MTVCLQPILHLSLIAVRDSHKTGPLIRDHTDDACYEEKRNYNDDDQIDRMRKQAAPSPQGLDDWPAAMILAATGNKMRPREMT